MSEVGVWCWACSTSLSESTLSVRTGIPGSRRVHTSIQSIRDDAGLGTWGSETDCHHYSGCSSHLGNYSKPIATDVSEAAAFSCIWISISTYGDLTEDLTPVSEERKISPSCYYFLQLATWCSPLPLWLEGQLQCIPFPG